MTETEYFWINGHRNDCAYVRSLDDDIDEGHEQCDCGKDDDEGFWDEDEDLAS